MDKSPASSRPRGRELGIAPGIFSPGLLNAITDVSGVRVGHFTLIQGEDIRTGATAILPHGGNLYQDKVPAGIAVGNGFGKLMGSTQIQELGEIETPIVLTNTLAVPRAAEAILDWVLQQPGNHEVRSVNPVVGETNDGMLNDIRYRALTAAMIRDAIETAKDGQVEEGSIGAGTGTTAFGWKAGIGTSSRKLPDKAGGYILGVLVQSNFAGVLQVSGFPIGRKLGTYAFQKLLEEQHDEGSIIIVVATDAPLSDRNLTRLARRALGGLARTGASLTNGSGDYVIAFSTAQEVRRTPQRREKLATVTELPNSSLSPLFQAVIESTEEAIYNSLFKATTVTGYKGLTVEALPIDQIQAILHST
ncbi:MAG: P1 family peptidase [Chloroflexota bacterium]